MVSPDLGSVTRAGSSPCGWGPPGHRGQAPPRPNVCEVMNIIGEVKGKHAFLVDDMVDTAGASATPPSR